MENRYTKKYNLLLEKFMEIDASNEKLQNRICHIRKQIRYLRRLKRLLIQKLVVCGDRFMDVCLEIPDMEPGANVEDQIIRRVAEVPHPLTPPFSQHPSVSRSSSVHPSASNVSSSSIGSNSGTAPPAKKRRRTTVAQDESGPILSVSSATGVNEIATAAPLSRSASYNRKSMAAASTSGASTPSNLLRSRRESMDLSIIASSSSATTPSIQSNYHQVSASVEDVVNSVVFDCQQRRNKEADEKIAKEEPIDTEAAIVPSEEEKVDIIPMDVDGPHGDTGKNDAVIVKQEEVSEKGVEHGKDEINASDMGAQD